jgi:hypothetical protein
MDHMGNIRMTLEYPLQQWQFPHIEKFRYGWSHVSAIESNGFLGTSSPSPLAAGCTHITPRSSIVNLLTKIITIRSRWGSHFMQHPKRPLSLNFKHAHILFTHDFIDGASAED